MSSNAGAKTETKIMTKNLYLVHQVEYLCWFGYLNRLGRHNNVHLILWKEKSVCTPFHFGNLPLSDPLPLGISVTPLGEG